VSSMIDLSCTGCRRRFGYVHGEAPRCYHCGKVNDASEVDALIVELKEFEEQRDAHDAIQGTLRAMSPASPHAKSVVRRLAFTIGADPEAVIAFVTQAKPLPAAELEQVRKWMKGRTATVNAQAPVPMDAVARASQLMSAPPRERPVLALEYARHLASSLGLCGEIVVTAFAAYAQAVEGLPCADSLYQIGDSEREWFRARAKPPEWPASPDEKGR
jgi:hypothetical protein